MWRLSKEELIELDMIVKRELRGREIRRRQANDERVAHGAWQRWKWV